MVDAHRLRTYLVLLTLALLTFGSTDQGAALGDLTKAQRRTVHRAETDLRKARLLIRDGDFDEAYVLVKKVSETAAKLSAEVEDEELSSRQFANRLNRRLSEIRGILELEGFEFPVTTTPKKSKNDEPAAPTEPTTPKQPAEPTKISFKAQVAPILVEHCVNCHGGDEPKGDLNMETFKSLSRGVGGAAIIDPGKSAMSKIVEVVGAGDMPKGDDKITKAELATIVTWIDQGAIFDGLSLDQSLRELAAISTPTTRLNEPSGADDKQPVEFSTHIAPVLAANCLKCHGTQRPIRANFSVANFRRLMTGGDSGKVITPGKSAESLIIQKIRGTAADGNRMPLNSPPLSVKVIGQFEKWIQEGAKFDGESPEMPVEKVAELASLKSLSHEQIAERRAELADKNWQLALADVKLEKATTKNFLIYASIGKKRVDEIAAAVEQQQTVVRKALELPRNGPLVKGRMTLFVFRERVDYSEFTFMIERQPLEPNVRGHWKYNAVDAYACVVLSNTRDKYDLAPLLFQQIVGTTVAARSDGIPLWFSEGTGRAVAAKTYAKEPRIMAWEELLTEQIKTLENPDDFLENRLSQANANVLSYGFVTGLMTQRQHPSFLKDLWGGKKFSTTFLSVYKAKPLDAATQWLAAAKKKRR